MIRTLTGLCLSLVLAGAAHAEGEQVVVHTAELSAQAVRVQLYEAAKSVCADAGSLNPWAASCVDDAYADALHQLNASHVRRPTNDRTALLTPR